MSLDVSGCLWSFSGETPEQPRVPNILWENRNYLEQPGFLQDQTPFSWCFLLYKPFSNWAKELDGTNQSATLEKHWSALARLGTSVAALAHPTGASKVKEHAGLQATSGQGKGKKAATNVEEVEEILLYDLPVSLLFDLLIINFWSVH